MIDLTDMESRISSGITQSNRPALDEEKFGPRTLRKDIRMFSKKMDWKEAYLLLKHCLEMVSLQQHFPLTIYVLRPLL